MRTVTASTCVMISALAALLGLGAAGSAPAHADTVHVDDEAPLGGDGTTWDTAFKYLQDALADANPGDEIRVAQGDYTPDLDEAGHVTPGDREATFQLLNGVGLYGGYRGAYDGTGLPADDHDVAGFKTTLTGDLANDDVEVSDPEDLLDEPTRAENSYHVVTGSWTDDSAVLEGFTVAAGNANEYGVWPHAHGGGMFNDGGSPTVNECTFFQNSAEWGGAISNSSGSGAVLTDCAFAGNSASLGGGAINTSDSMLLLVKCLFRENGAGEWGGAVCNGGTYNPGITLVACSFISNYAKYGGGLLDWYTNPLTVVGCEFLGNISGDHGGAVLTGDSYASFMNCVFSGNFAPGGGGAMHNYLSSDVTLTNCTVSHNSAYAEAGGLVNRPGCQGAVRNCVLWGNSSSGAGSLESWQIYGDWTDVEYSCIQGLDAFAGAGNIETDPLFVDADGPDNVVGTDDDNLRLRSGSPCIDAADNTAVPADTADLDNDGDTSERVPLDLDREPRFFDDPHTDDTGVPDPPDYPEVVDMGAYEGPEQVFIITGEPVSVPEGGFSGFHVSLALDPQGTVYASVVHVGGDPDITVLSGGPLELDSSNYWIPQPVGLAAAEDVDWANGTAVIRVSATGIPTVDVTATEEDNEPIPPVVFVDESATGDNNGTSWDDAFGELRDALNATETRPGTEEIWVAAGTYTPADPGGDRLASLQLVNDLGVYGGFAGDETEREQRDVTANVTVLSGDLNDDDAEVSSPEELLNEPTRAENSYHVVIGSGTDDTAILDGFTVRGGFADGPAYGYTDSGGGMYNSAGSPTVSNCTFAVNFARGTGGIYGGGGMANRSDSSPTLTNCVFSGNFTQYLGGGMFNERSSPTLVRCTFSGNAANLGIFVNSNGGGMYNYDSSKPLLIDCLFVDNAAQTSGGAMTNWGDSNPTLVNCRFSGNSTYHSDGRGGGLANYASSPKLRNCIFTDNEAGNGGGGGVSQSTSGLIKLTNCTLSNNSTSGSGGGLQFEDSAVLTNCVFWENNDSGGMDETAQIDGDGALVNYSCVQGWTGGFGGLGNHGEDPLLTDPGNDDHHLLSGSPCIDTGDPWADYGHQTDIDGQMRVWDGDGNGQARVDMGSDEFGSFRYGDLNCDGAINGFDIDAFVLALQATPPDYAEYYAQYPDCDHMLADINGDGTVNGFDIDAFVELLSDG
ncbi:MAG: right-handed parallel beta-helix repeat-containing protein [Planctomycetes bacterium]|nr:right-handed parallel beta-helix repeat-containing protein [Planctomycetota bacterium]